MLLKESTSLSLLHVHQLFQTKDEAIRFLIHQLKQEGSIASESAFYQAVIDREALSPTGFEGGLAIPHGKSDTVLKASFAIATLEKPVADWESIDPENRVELVILLAIPTAEAGSTHLSLLSEFVTRLTDESSSRMTENAPLFRSFLKSSNEKELRVKMIKTYTFRW